MIINNEEEEELPKPNGSKGDKGEWLPPASNDKLISTGPRFNRKRREKELQDLEKKKEEQIYNKNREEEEEKLQEEKKVQVVYMKPNGSFVFQTLMEFHQVYSILYFIIEELLFIYKCNYFHYEPYAAVFEILCLIFYLFIQFGRFYFGSLGNRAEASLFVIFCIIFSIGALYSYVHYMLLQTYVLQIEIITNSVGLVLWFLEVIFAVIAFLRISGKESGI
jgi:hypothetical protein